MVLSVYFSFCTVVLTSLIEASHHLKRHMIKKNSKNGIENSKIFQKSFNDAKMKGLAKIFTNISKNQIYLNQLNTIIFKL